MKGVKGTCSWTPSRAREMRRRRREAMRLRCVQCGEVRGLPMVGPRCWPCHRANIDDSPYETMPYDPAREARIKLYAERAALELPLFIESFRSKRR